MAGHEPIKRSVTIAGHRTSISLEEPFWLALKEISAKRGLTVPKLIREIDKTRDGNGLSSAIRVYLLIQYRGSEFDKKDS